MKQCAKSGRRGARGTPEGAEQRVGPQPSPAHRSRSVSEKVPHDPARGLLWMRPNRDPDGGKSQQPRAQAVRPLGSAPSFCKMKDWLEPSEEEVATASDKRCFLFPAWESVSDKREEKIMPRSEGSGCVRRSCGGTGSCRAFFTRGGADVFAMTSLSNRVLPSQTPDTPAPVHAASVQEADSS